ncbi:hypothetical protein F503_07816 [Ophiostoma piceae UAMH 11346]|uniref:NADAR domain-containing protein n=1 Tax=Ophiostoma piceae (strain UAMH 11346) TaxID=1262450 RepID=S3D1P2_OPHP1|nr:hypothetical protein F503_07816 [Ophiostoma piceae UAMH 11346]
MGPKNKSKNGGSYPKPEAEHDDFIFFHKEWEDYGFLSNYTPAKFSAPDPALACAAWLISENNGVHTSSCSVTIHTDNLKDIPAIQFNHSEQYYMYCKAVCFGDTAAASSILAASKASDCKDTARQIRHYDAAVWAANGRKLRVMADALWYKFGGAHLQQVLEDGGSWLGREARFETLPDLGRKLLATGDCVLVEAAGRDSFWGIGYGIKQRPFRYQKNWGQNHLGKSLISTRERLRKLVEALE